MTVKMKVKQQKKEKMNKLNLKNFYVNYRNIMDDWSGKTLVEAVDKYSALVEYLSSNYPNILDEIKIDLNDIPNTIDEIVTKIKCDYNIILDVESIEEFDIKLQEYSINTLREQISMFDYHIKTADHSKSVNLIRIFFDYFTEVEMFLFKEIVKNYESFDIFDLELYATKYKKVILNTALLNNMKSDLESHLNNLESKLHLFKVRNKI
jgi:hypothetical protein